MEIKILGICGSPIKGGNTEVFLNEALKAAENTGNVQTELISLAGKEIKDKGTYGMATPKFLSSEFFKTQTGKFADKNASLIIVSQVRENLNAGMFGKKHKRSGGKALDFYAHTVLWLTTWIKIKKKDVDGNERQIGVIVEAKTEKSKTPRPYRTCK